MSKSKTVVIKIGTKVIASSDKSLDKAMLKGLINQISDILDKGMKVIVVTSGAIGAGMGLLGMKKRPMKLEELQAIMSRPATWRVLDVAIGVVMLAVALNVATIRVAP